MRPDAPRLEPRGLDRKRTILLLRSVVIVSLSYLVLFTETGTAPESVAYTLGLILSNGLLALVPATLYSDRGFAKWLFLFDTACVLVGLYLTVGLSQDFLIVYFFTMLLTAMVDGIGQIAVGAVAVSVTYGAWLWMTANGQVGSAEWLRLPFFFIVAVFYAYMTEEVKLERIRRQQAERETEHLRFLLAMGDAVSAPGSPGQWADQVKQAVEAAFPRLACEVVSSLPAGPTGTMHWAPLVVRGRTFGGLRVTPADDRGLSADEKHFCDVAALVAANGLFAAEQAHDAGRMKHEFLSTMSHELRTPLHAILGYVELLETVVGPEADPVLSDSLGRMRFNSLRLQNLLEEMLLFAELRAGGSRMTETEDVDLASLFAALEPDVLARIESKPVRFAWRVDPDVPVLRTDGRKVRQIVNGLLSNAAKFTDRGTIGLRARRLAPDTIEIGVEDSGIGIRSSDFELIFEAFRQLDGSLTRRADGLGLGLALVRELTTILGGEVRVESDVERGSTFRVRLPIGTAPVVIPTRVEARSRFSSVRLSAYATPRL